MSTAIVVDCRSRDLQVFSASVTQTVIHGLVIRKAADLGCLRDFAGGNIPHTVILLGSYAAQSSAGFVSVLRPAQHHERFLVGAAGLGWEKRDPLTWGTARRCGDALRPLTDRSGGHLRCTVMESGCSLAKIGGEQKKIMSNTATAAAALAGFRIRAVMRGEVIVAEGQSDRVSGWAFRPTIPSNGLGEDFPPEHREDVFAGVVVTPARGDPPAVKRVRKPPPPATPPSGDFVEVRED